MPRSPRLIPALLALLLLSPAAPAQEAGAAPPDAASAPVAEDGVRSTSLVEFGEAKYGPDFAHFQYADPAAPKGGTLTLGATESFDSLNPLPLQGQKPRSLQLLLDTLMVASQDEVSSYYPLIAEAVEVPADRSWIVFELNPAARWHDGRPITADDVAWTFDRLRAVGDPFQRSFYEDVDTVEVLDEHRVRFALKTRGTMKPLVRLAGLAVMPRHWWEAEGRDVGRSTTEPPLGSGPYRIAAVEPGRTLIWERVPDYWAADLPVNRGSWNFDRIRYDYYKDRDIQFEAFKAGAYDFRRDFTSRLWATGYDLPAVADGRLIKTEVPTLDFRGMQGFFMNTRRDLFHDRRVRQAMQYLMPFEFIRGTLMYGNYARLTSYFTPGSDWASSGLPEGQELALLEPFRGQVPDEVFTTPHTLPENPSQGTALSRENRRAALDLLGQAGWEIQGGRLVEAAAGRPFAFEILLGDSGLEPHAQAFVQNLRQVGMQASIRIVDSAQFQKLYQDHDFDVISFAYTFYPPPGSELANYFGSEAADTPGSANLMGIRDPVVDALIRTIVTTDEPEAKQAATRALDRVMLWGEYAVPQWYNDVAWVAYWDRFGFPPVNPSYDFGLANTVAFQPTWWIDEAKDAALAAAR